MSGVEGVVEQPRFTVSGGATDEELAALVAVLSAALAPDTLKPAADRPLAGGWKSYYRTVRTPLVNGRDAWRTFIRF
ncbi:MAG: acyl-CoA carboxylase epsilon subunit [Arachnia propionica]|uniref:acyl-CoA carboxylase epsilon subunit n=1 Tax=Arachnia propionica TaxID=1750 RepID=UPI0027112A42|nr:acyl-CoA carboxylase epsilon subunit [Arachnia propionica]